MKDGIFLCSTFRCQAVMSAIKYAANIGGRVEHRKYTKILYELLAITVSIFKAFLKRTSFLKIRGITSQHYSHKKILLKRISK